MGSDAAMAPGLGLTKEFAESLLLDSPLIYRHDGLPDTLRRDQYLQADGLADHASDIPENMWDTAEEEPSLLEQLGRGDWHLGTDKGLAEPLHEPLVPGMASTTSLATTGGATIPQDPPHPSHKTSNDMVNNDDDLLSNAYNGNALENITTMDHGTASQTQNVHTTISTQAATTPAPGLRNTITTMTNNAMMPLPTQQLAPYITSTFMHTTLYSSTLPNNPPKAIPTNAPPNAKPPNPSTKPPRKPSSMSPIEHMRPLVRALNALLPQGHHLLYPDGTVTNNIKDKQILSYLKNILGHPESPQGCAPHPVWGLKDGSTLHSYLARLLTWALGRIIAEEIVKQMVNRPPGKGYAASVDTLNSHKVYSANFPLPLTQNGCRAAPGPVKESQYQTPAAPPTAPPAASLPVLRTGAAASLVPMPSLTPAMLNSAPQANLGVPVGPVAVQDKSTAHMVPFQQPRNTSGDPFDNTLQNIYRNPLGSIGTDLDTARNNTAASGGVGELYPEISMSVGLGGGDGGAGGPGFMVLDAGIADLTCAHERILMTDSSLLPGTYALQTIGVKRTAAAMSSDAHGTGRNKRANSAAAGAVASGAGPSTLPPDAAAATLSPPAAGTQGVQWGEAGSAAGLDQFVSKMFYASEIEFSSYLKTVPRETLAHFAWLSRRQAQVADAFRGQT